MDLDLDLMETSIDNEVSSLEQTYENNNRIIEAVLVADKLEQQYRMQGYSEAQIQQFHEKVMDKIKFWKKKETVADKAKGAIGGAWEWIKKMVTRFVNFCKKVWLKITSFFATDEQLLEKYKNELSRIDKIASKVKMQVPSLKSVDPFRKLRFFKITTSASDYKSAAESINNEKINYEEILVNYYNIKKYLDNVKRQTFHQDHIRKALEVAKKGKDADTEKARAYIAYLNASLKAYIRYDKAAHTAIRKAIVSGIAQARKLNTNEATQILEQQITDVQYMYESLIDENNRSIMPLIEQVTV